jgi:2-methylcitrate dehydratase PrpD
VSATVTARVASWASNLRLDQVPADLREWLGLRVADSIGLIAVARGSEPGRAVLDVCRPVPGDVPLLFEQTEVSASMAALAHGTLVHALDYDDTYPDSVIHPSSVVVPAALAAGVKADGRQVMLAMLAGYEFLARCGAVVGRRLHARGFHATAVLGPLAAALVASTVSGRGELAALRAMGLAGSMSGGLLEFLADGSWSKRMHPGWAAHGGLLAAELAAAGFSGPASILEGRNGIFRSFLDDPDPEPALAEAFADLGDRWSCVNLQFKRYPCAHVIHPYLDLALFLLRAHHVDAAQITSVRCDVAPWCVPIVLEPIESKRAPSGEYQARASLPYALATALADGSVGPATFEDDALRRAEVLRLAAAVDYREDESLSASFQARLSLRLSSGEVLEADTGDLPSRDEPSLLRAKFDANLGIGAPGCAADDLWAAATSLAETGPAELARLCSPAVRR